MKALTIWQPWASAIIEAGKPLENRGWAPPRPLIGQRIAIHAGKTLDKYASECLNAGDWIVTWKHKPAALPRGAIIGTVRLIGFARTGQEVEDRLGEAARDWYSGEIAWLFSAARSCEPIPIRGAQGLWTVPEEIARALEWPPSPVDPETRAK